MLGKDGHPTNIEHYEDANLSLKTDSTVGYSSADPTSMEIYHPSNSVLVLPDLPWRMDKGDKAEKMAKVLANMQK